MKTALIPLATGLWVTLACLQFHNSLHAQPCATVTNGLVAWWKAEHNAMDSVGPNHGRGMLDLGIAEGHVGRAFSFGGSAYVEVPHSESLSFGATTPMSFEFWAYRTSAKPGQFILRKQVDCGDYNYQVYYHENGVGWGPMFVVGALPLNIWTHLAGTFDGANFRLFVNGQLSGTAAGTLGPVNTTPLLLGGSGFCERDQYTGLLDEVAIYNRALSAAEVVSIFLAGSAGKCGGLTFEVYDPPQWAISQEAGRVRFSMTGVPGDRYVVEATTDLSITNVYFDGCECFGPAMVVPWSPYWLLFQDGIAPASIMSSPTDAVRFFRGRKTRRYYANQSGRLLFDRERPLGIYGTSMSGRWLFTNEKLGLEPIIRLRTPGVVDATTHLLAAIPGSLPANGPIFYLNPSTAQWAAAFSVFTTFNGGGQSFSNLPYGGEIYDAPLPPPRRTGRYAVDFMLRNPVSGNLESFASESFLYGTAPQMFLRLNRPIANSIDFMNATVELSAGANPASTPVRVAAWLRTPAGEELSLPALTPGFSLLFDGPAQATNFTLFSRSLVDFAPGDYRFEARMYDAHSGALRALATAPWMLCDGVQGTITGTVYSAQGQTLGAGAGLTSVDAFDLDDGGVTAAGLIEANGTFTLSLEAGRYLLSASVADSSGWHKVTNSVPLTVICGATNFSLSLTAAPPTVPHPERAGAKADGPSLMPQALNPPPANDLPPPLLFLLPINHGVPEDDLQFAFNFFGSTVVNRTAGSVSIIEPDGINAVLQLRELARMLGGASPDSDGIIGALGAQFVLFFEAKALNDEIMIDIRLVDTRTQEVLRSQRIAGLSGRALWDKSVAAAQFFLNDPLAEVDQRTLLGLLRVHQGVPVLPHLSLSVSPEEARVNQSVTATATLRERDSSGPRIAGKEITFSWASPSGDGMATRVTDSDGSASIVLPQSQTGEGIVTVRFGGANQSAASQEARPFRVIGDQALALSSPNAQVPSGGQSTISLRLVEATLPRRGMPRANAFILIEATNASITSASGTNDPNGSLWLLTGANGDAAITFTGGANGGLAVIRATFTDPNNQQTTTASLFMNIETGVATALFATPTNLLIGSRSFVTLDTLVSGARVAGLPVEFTVSGPGSLTVGPTQSDDSGQANTRYTPPASGQGLATVTSIVTIYGRRYTNTTDISYTDIPCTNTTSYNNVTDWSFTTNAPGQWRYGWVSGQWTPNDWPAITLYTLKKGASEPGNFLRIDYWYDPSSDSRNVVGYNAAETFTHGDGATTFASGKITFHPGFAGIRSVFRWVAPCSGRATVSASFQRRVKADNGDGVEVFVFHRDQEMHHALIPGSAALGTAFAFNQAFPVAAGDTVDFMVGPSPSNSESHDTTQLDATIMLTPAP